jgi:tRNA uridine 5-carboxymethylaminomethyl modification enzyme
LLIDEVVELIIENNVIIGVKTKNNNDFFAKCVIVTAGTYMNSLTHIGHTKYESGPDISLSNNAKLLPTDCERSNNLSDQLKKLNFTLIRLKTGTPPRIKINSIDFSRIQKEYGTNKNLSFSYSTKQSVPFEKQVPCYLTYTNEKTHTIILDNIKLSAMYSGNISGVGPRYCPSIEDKCVRFSDKLRHQLFIEPVSKDLDFMYIQGMSTSLPEFVQEKFIRSIIGLENAEFARFGYAIEYDAIDPTQLFPTLETKRIQNLFFAGQINGTSGYEEAAGQGIVAGINAIAKIKKLKPLILKNEESYIGVMIEDIVTKGVTDPYRLLTSRADHRLYLRNDNADDRLINYGKYYGLVDDTTYQDYLEQQNISEKIILELKNTKIDKELISKYGTSAKTKYVLLKRQNVRLEELLDEQTLKLLSSNSVVKIEILAKFEGYIKKQEKYIKQISKSVHLDISKIKDYSKINNLSLEAREKLNKIMPLTLGQAHKVPGINSTDIMAIKLFLEKK